MTLADERVPMLSFSNLFRDFTSSIVVFLVALPLCLGVALASNAPLFSGIIAGIVGGIVVGWLSGSHTSVSGPAAGLTAVVAAQIANLGTFEAFLLAVVIGGTIQIGLGIAGAGAMSAFFPSSVIKGLLAAIGVIIILKQIPHLLGHDNDPTGEMSFIQPDKHNTFSELLTLFQGEFHLGAASVGLISLVILVVWDHVKFLKKSGLPSALIAVLAAVGLHLLYLRFGEGWKIDPSHLVQIPIAESLPAMWGLLSMPDFSQFLNPTIYVAGLTIAIVASLESLLNLEAVDNLDPRHRHSPPNRELIAQGVGNVAAGLIGGIPVTSVIVRSSVNVNAGASSKLSAIFHGFLLLICVALVPVYLNMIPLSALAAILIVTGFKLAKPALFRQMWLQGRYQFIPFMITLGAIVFTDLLIGILIGLGVSALFILNSNLRRPIRRIVEKHLGGDIVHVELANQVSFLNRAALTNLLNDGPRGTKYLIDASGTDYIDPDILELIRDFKENVGPARGVSVSLRGFRDKYELHDEIQFADYTTRELQNRVTPQQVLEILKDGNLRFQTGHRISRDFSRQVCKTAAGQNPLAVVLSCIDSRVPSELIFDLGIGDIFSVRVAGNVIGTKSLASIEFGVAVANAKLVVVMGHTRCGAVTAAVDFLNDKRSVEQASGCANLHVIVDEIQLSIGEEGKLNLKTMNAEQKELFIDLVARRNVMRTLDEIVRRSKAIQNLVDSGRIMVVGAIYDVKTGMIDFYSDAESDDDLYQVNGADIAGAKTGIIESY